MTLFPSLILLTPTLNRLHNIFTPPGREYRRADVPSAHGGVSFFQAIPSFSLYYPPTPTLCYNIRMKHTIYTAEYINARLSMTPFSDHTKFLSA